MTLLTIITITKNDPIGLELTLSSIPNHTNIECLVIDGSDTTCIDSVVDRILSSSLFPITVHREINTGIFNAMNQGLFLASSKWLIFMNSGDCFTPNNRLISFLEQPIPPHVKSLIFTSELYNSNGSYLGTNPPLFPTSHRVYNSLTRIIPSLFWPCHQSIVFLRSCHILYPYDIKSIGSDRSIIKLFFSFPYLFFNESVSIFSLDGISSTGPKSLKQLKIQLTDSLLLNDTRRIVSLVFKYLLNSFNLSLLLYYLRIFRYRLISPLLIFIIKFFKL